MKKKRISHIDAYHLAIEIAKEAGFKLSHASMRTESTYFTYPGREPRLLRLSAHKSNGSPMGLNNVVARVSFTPHQIPGHTVDSMRKQMRFAIGEYFITDPKPSRYKGKRGTWETMGSVVTTT